MKHYFNTRSTRLIIATCMVVGMLGIYTSPLFGSLVTNVTSAQAKPAGKGLFKVGASPLRKDKNIKLKMTADDRQALQAIASDLNKVFILPQDIYLSVNVCGETNAFYNSCYAARNRAMTLTHKRLVLLAFVASQASLSF